MSKRSEIAERIAEKIRGLSLCNPYGGDVSQLSDTKGKPYAVSFAVPAYVDGQVTVYGEKFILVQFQAVSQGKHSLVVESEAIAIQMIELIARYDWIGVFNLPTKKQKPKPSVSNIFTEEERK